MKVYERDDLELMLKDLRAGLIDGIVAYDLDRLARQPRDLERLIEIYDERPRLEFATVTNDINIGTPDGRTMARIARHSARSWPGSASGPSARGGRSKGWRAPPGRHEPRPLHGVWVEGGRDGSWGGRWVEEGGGCGLARPVPVFCRTARLQALLVQ
ncbi:recombinase family protein [Streptomyces sp. NPDC004658]|uniref:recombinase family protein n=1 Tax=Streptomyces sp. NPDC004658 TaxID=3154672 RepID=UPI0033B4E450